MNRRLLSWIPALAVPAVLVAGAIAIPAVASASPALAPKSAAEVLELLAKAKSVTAFSGTITETSNLGLPSLPTGAGTSGASAYGASDGTAGASDVLALLTGSHTIRVYASGAHATRVQVLQSESEQDVVTDSTGAWLWDSAKQTATHVLVPAGAGSNARRFGTGESLTPSEAANELVSAAQKTSLLSVDGTATVAGRAAYVLTITPKTADTLVGSASIAVDATTGLPLSVSVTARGASAPAFSTAFTDIDYAKPAASLFAFTPPAGATVKTVHLSSASKTPPSRNEGAKRHEPGAKPTVSGTGWSSVVTIPAKDVPKGLSDETLVKELTTSVSGGRGVQTALLSVLVASDGRVLVGAVPLSSLAALAG